MSNHDEYRKLEDLAREQGWTVDKTSNGHIKFIPPPGSSGHQIMTGSTPGDRRAYLNTMTDLRRQGLDISKLRPTPPKQRQEPEVPAQDDIEVALGVKQRRARR